MQHTGSSQKKMHSFADFGKTSLVHRLPRQENHIPPRGKARKKWVEAGPQPALRPVTLHGRSDRAARHHPNSHLLNLIVCCYQHNKRVRI
jgi:hypothetical protein